MKVTGKAIALLSLVGSILLIYLLISDYLSTNISDVNFVIWVMVLLFASTRLVAAILAFQEIANGITVLILCFLFEIFAFAIGKFTYLISVGPFFFVKYDKLLNKLGIDFGPFQVAYKIDFSGEYSFFSINLFVLFAISILVAKKNHDIYLL